jgi:MFS family permease
MAGLFGCLVAVATTDIIGRRYLCIIGATLAIMFSALIGGIGPLPNRTTDQNNVVIASVILLNGVCKLGVASQCWLIGSEIGGIQMRKRMIGWATSIDVLAAFLVTFCTPYLQAGPQIQMGARVGFVFMGCAVIALFFFIFFLPELKGRSLEEVDDLFKVGCDLHSPLRADEYSATFGPGSSVRPKHAVPVRSSPILEVCTRIRGPTR